MLYRTSCSFSVGDSFSTFEDLENKVKEDESTHFVQFWKRDARTIGAAKKRLDKFLKPELKYYKLNRFDAISAYMRKMDRYGLGDF